MRSANKNPKLTLVGAGPGDPELITLKAIRALESADVVLYDALVSAEILKLIPFSVPAISVGKRARTHSFTQDEINDLILESALAYGHVVRLKGGDPFVFGRAAEEIEFALKNNISVDVIPGISSALAAPAAFDIPVTARGISESFWVVTGTTMDHKISDDIRLAAQSTATIVILMGLHKIEEIMVVFESFGRSNTPAAVIENGTLPSQRAVMGTVSTIVELVREEAIKSPATIVVGEVVKYARNLRKVALAHAHLINV